MKQPEKCDNCPNNTGGEKMDVLIEISEEDFINIFINGLEKNKLFKIIKKGTPLPENHGRLIDLDELFKTLNSEKIPVIEDINYILRHAPVIIEASDQEE